MSDDLPPGWVTRESTSRKGAIYYYNTNTGESSWSRPQSETVRASHILVKHNKSRRPASWKDPQGLDIKHRTVEQADAQLTALRAKIVKANNQRLAFEAEAKVVSDCSSAARGGDLGDFGRGQMQKPFEEATFALELGQVSQIIHTDSGSHIILRTG